MNTCTFLQNSGVLSLDYITIEGGVIRIAARAASSFAACPLCGHRADRVHSRYRRQLLDLPWQGNAVRFELGCRKFFCENRECNRRIFAEPLPAVAERYARKTCRLADALRELCYLVGGEAAARIARTFGLLVSPDALLRHLKKRRSRTVKAPRVLGIDDFAFRRGNTYGTILVDLEKHLPVDLLPDRDAKSVEAWLKKHPGVEIVSRDRGIPYIEGVTKGAPDAVQVADRWHLLKNLGDSLERLLVRHHATLKEASTVPTSQNCPAELAAVPTTKPSEPNPRSLADKQARHDRRQTRFDEVKRLLAEGHSLRDVARATGISRNTIAKFAALSTLPTVGNRSPRSSKITPFAGELRRRWCEGVCDATRLHREIVSQGFTGTVSSVQRYVQSWREKPRHRIDGRIPPVRLSPRQCSWMLTNPNSSRVNDEQRQFLQRLTQNCPTIETAQRLAQEFSQLIRERRGHEFGAWLKKAETSEVPELESFARSLRQDSSAVEAGMSLSWSNGQTEGQVNRLKFVKRQMYGRAGFDLLRARVLPQSTI